MWDSCLESVLGARLPVGPFLGLWVAVLLDLGILSRLGVSFLLGVFPVFRLGIAHLLRVSSLMGILPVLGL